MAHRIRELVAARRLPRTADVPIVCHCELEDLLKAHYGEQYRHEASIHIPEDYEKREVPNPMYMPVLAGFRSYEVDTRMIVFNWEGPERPVGFRLDLMKP